MSIESMIEKSLEPRRQRRSASKAGSTPAKVKPPIPEGATRIAVLGPAQAVLDGKVWEVRRSGHRLHSVFVGYYDPKGGK